MQNCYRWLPIPNLAAQLSDALEVALIRPLPFFATCKICYINGIGELKLPLPGLAPLRHADGCCRCLFIGEDRKWPTDCQNDAIGPETDMEPVSPFGWLAAQAMGIGLLPAPVAQFAVNSGLI